MIPMFLGETVMYHYYPLNYSITIAHLKYRIAIAHKYLSIADIYRNKSNDGIIEKKVNDKTHLFVFIMVVGTKFTLSLTKV